MFKRSSILKASLVLGLAANASVQSAWAIPEMAWDEANSPSRLLLAPGQYDSRFDESGTRVPFTARVPNARIPYADTYWPTNRGGIAYRWNGGSPWVNPYLVDMVMHHLVSMPSPAEQREMDENALVILRQFEKIKAERPEYLRWIEQNAHSSAHYATLSREQVLAMSRDQLARLSPAEKYDLVRSKYDFPLTHTVQSKGMEYAAYWGGICHGWAPASINHAEPLPVDVRSADGRLVVPFGSADVKALLDYMYANPGRSFFGLFKGKESAVNQLGFNCFEKLDPRTNTGRGRCAGANAGAFHVALTNYIGLRHSPFIADVSHGNEIWNNAIYEYTFKVVDKRNGPMPGAAPGTVRSVRIQTSVKFPSDDERFAPQWEATVGHEEVQVPEDYGAVITPELKTKLDHGYRYDVGEYDYWLDLGPGDVILGGSWVSFERPDYLWLMPKHQFKGEFEDLARIYRPAFGRQ